jgi:hypothetical protein
MDRRRTVMKNLLVVAVVVAAGCPGAKHEPGVESPLPPG